MPQRTSSRMVRIIGVRRPSTCHGRTISSAFANAWSGMEPTASFWHSWAWQMNIALCIRGRGAQGVRFTCFSMAQWNRGVLALTRRVRAAIHGQINPEAVVLGETTSGPMVRAWDGGFSMDFIYSQRDANRERMAASPMRYYNPRANWFTNGTTINELIKSLRRDIVWRSQEETAGTPSSSCLAPLWHSPFGRTVSRTVGRADLRPI